MQLGESIELLNDLGMLGWHSRDTEESTRLLVNTVAEQFLGERELYDLRPYVESEYLHDYFLKTLGN